MLKDLLNQIIPVAITAIVAIATVIIKNVGDAAVNLIATKKAETENKIGITKYNQTKETGKDIWNIVEERFRVSEIVGKVTEQKVALFNKLLKEKFPSLTDTEIESIRQAIAGEVNKGKIALSDDVVALQSKVTELANVNAALTAENAQLKQTINTVQSTVKI